MSDDLLTPTAAAHLISSETGRPFSPDSVKYYSDTNRLPVVRTTTGTRLYRAADLRRLAETLVDRGERRSE